MKKISIFLFAFIAVSNVFSQMLIVPGNGSFSGTLTTGGDITVTSGDLVLQDGKVTVRNWSIEAPDYVFDTAYKSASIEEVADFIKKNRHLPEIPSASEMKNTGIDLTEMNLRLLKKVEELTLWSIEQEKRIKQLEQNTPMNK